MKSAFTEKNLLLAFKMFDKDNDGSLSYSEIKGLFGNESKNSVIENLLKEIGKTKQGCINFEAFKNLMMGIG